MHRGVDRAAPAGSAGRGEGFAGQPECLDPWLQRAQDSAVPALQRFVEQLLSDYDAVRAAVTLAWSDGRVEGQNVWPRQLQSA